MQEQLQISPSVNAHRDALGNQGLVVMLALVGSKRMEVASLRTRTRLTPSAFGSLLDWLREGYLVDVVATLDGERIRETVELTDRGEATLLELLEMTCELPELR